MSDAILSDCCHLSYGNKIHQNQRITESLRTEKTSKINKSNCQAIAIMNTTSLSATFTQFLKTSRDGDLTPPAEL